MNFGGPPLRVSSLSSTVFFASLPTGVCDQLHV
jgi:hypothetical protein